MKLKTQPTIILHKYRSILIAAMIVEGITFLVSLTDSIVAANLVDLEAFNAIGLMAPFFSISTFIAAVLNSGIMLNYSYQVGSFNEKRANQYFSEGVIFTIAGGVLLTVILMLTKNVFLHSLSIDASTENYLSNYYDIIIFYFLFAPISCLLDNIVIADGGEKFSAAVNLLQIIGNVILSIVLASLFGIRGIAIATVICKVAFVFLIATLFLRKKCTVRFVLYFSIKDMADIVRRGVVRASTFAMTALMTFVLNQYILEQFDKTVFSVWVVNQKILGLSSVFLGLVLTLQPLIGALKAENNTSTIRILLRRALRDISVLGGILTALIIAFTPTTLRIFGVREGEVMIQGITAVRIISLSLIFIAVTTLFFIYYFLIDRHILALIMCILKDFFCPVAIAILLVTVVGNNSNLLWIGISVSYPITLVIMSIILLVCFGKSQFPVLLSREQDKNVYIYSFVITNQNVSNMSIMAGQILSEHGYSRRLKNLASLCIEDILNLIADKNGDVKHRLLAECVLILEKDGVRVILRDNGEMMESTDEDALIDSLLQYVVANVISLADYKNYIPTTGYNRNVLYFKEDGRK